MNIRIIATAPVTLGVSGCTGASLNRDVRRQHVARNCRVRASVPADYALDGTGVGFRNVAFERCMRAAHLRDSDATQLADRGQPQAIPGRRRLRGNPDGISAGCCRARRSGAAARRQV